MGARGTMRMYVCGALLNGQPPMQWLAVVLWFRPASPFAFAHAKTVAACMLSPLLFLLVWASPVRVGIGRKNTLLV